MGLERLIVRLILLFVWIIVCRIMGFMEVKEDQNGIGIYRGVWIQGMIFHWIHLHRWIRLELWGKLVTMALCRMNIALDCLIFIHLTLILFLRYKLHLPFFVFFLAITPGYSVYVKKNVLMGISLGREHNLEFAEIVQWLSFEMKD